MAIFSIGTTKEGEVAEGAGAGGGGGAAFGTLGAATFSMAFAARFIAGAAGGGGGGGGGWLEEAAS